MSKIVSALANEGRIRVMACDIKEIVQEAVNRHGLYPTAAAALGRTMAISAMMAFTLKNEDELINVRISGDGPLELIRVDAYKNGNMVGFVKNPQVNMINELTHKLDVGGAVGKGQLSVTRNVRLKQPFTSSIELISGEIAEDFAYYFSQSEQLPSAVSLGVLVGEEGEILSAGGILIQMLPGHEEADIIMTEHVLGGLKPVSQILHEGMAVKELVEALFEDIEVVNETKVQFKCHCNKEQMERALRTLNEDDLKSLIEDDKPIELECQYCNEKYSFSQEEVKQMIYEKTVKN